LSSEEEGEMSRRSIEIEGFHHANPIPAASRIGPLLVSSVIAARDPGSDTTPDDPEAQIANLFRHVDAILHEAGADWRHIVRMSFWVSDIAVRPLINGPWLEHFPDDDSRPARHTQVAPGQDAVSCEFVAFVED
jgi:2-iminobutanoate/2-iminopropanoate deaminase